MVAVPIRACGKKFDPYFLVILFEGVRSKIRGVGRHGTIEVKLIFYVVKKRFFRLNFFKIFNLSFSYKTSPD